MFPFLILSVVFRPDEVDDVGVADFVYKVVCSCVHDDGQQWSASPSSVINDSCAGVSARAGNAPYFKKLLVILHRLQNVNGRTETPHIFISTFCLFM